MEEKKLSEQESLELISQMIRSTRKNMEVGSGNQFLYWGYFTAALLSCIVPVKNRYVSPASRIYWRSSTKSHFE